ncbi:MAG: sodium-translocating pyrophosphatase [Anaerolineae bacterium]|jgi:K(+)-stimulated pyrophosphate-energized sodium pump|nr:sodium-translocating pyrophosphatase [Anaerolineae bacterium]
MQLLLVPIISGLIAITVAVSLFLTLKKARIQHAEMKDVANDIALGVKTYLSRQFKTIILITPFVAVAIFAMLGLEVAITFVLGVLTSLATAFLGMNAAVRANLKTADDATESYVKAFHTAVFGGAVMGFSIIGFSIVSLSILYFIFGGDPEPLVGFGFGASLAALFAQIGGGIYTKSADVGADLVGKVEQRIPEDDPRNPAVVADLVGDNVGDCAGRGSDLFESFSDDIITGTIVSLLYVGKYGAQVMFLPLLMQSVGLFASLIGIFSIKTFKKAKPENAFDLGLAVTTAIATLGLFLVSRFLLNDMNIFIGGFLGIVVTLVVAFVTRYYAGMDGQPVKDIAEASKRGAALNIITGLASGLQSPLASIIMITGAVCAAYIISGGSLLAIVAVNIGTDMLIGYIMTADAFGPITDNAAGIAEMSGAQEKVVHGLSQLDAVGNTMKATTKAYAMSSGTVTAFVLFSTFFDMIGLKTMDISAPFSIAFLLLGTALPYLIASLVIGSTARTAAKMVDEVRRQFKMIPGILEGLTKPDYAACVDIATQNAIREMMLPGLISIIVPVLAGFLVGGWALGALLIGAIAGSALLGPFLNNVGTAFDNAKKIIEDAGRKGSFEHQAAVIADTVGDPLKDVAGPSILIFMKLIGMVSLLIAGGLKVIP